MRTRSLWIEGLTDAVAFVVGGLVGFGIARLLGLDIFAPGYGLDAMGGIVLVGLGAGGGRRVLRAWLARQDTDRQGP